MSTQHERMMLAAQKLLGIDNQAELARRIGQYDQMLTNWKARGIPHKEIMDVAKIIGCDPFWLRDGQGKMEGLSPRIAHLNKILQDQPDYLFDEAIKNIASDIELLKKAKNNGTQ